MNSPRVLVAGLSVVALWASAFPAIRVAAPELGVGGLSFVRLAVAALTLLAFAPVLGIRLPARRDLPLILACGFLGMAAYQILLNWGELYVPAGTASIIVAAAPLVSVAVAALALGERPTGFTLAGSAIAIAGVALVCLARSGLSLSPAVVILIGAMLVQGAYHPLTKSLLRRYSGLGVATYGMISGTIMLAPTIPFDWQALTTASAPAWWSAIYLGVAPSAVGFALWGYAVARLPVAGSTTLLYLVPPVAVLIAYVWLGELPYPAELVGGAIVVAGVIIVSRGSRLRNRLAGFVSTTRA